MIWLNQRTFYRLGMAPDFVNDRSKPAPEPLAARHGGMTMSEMSDTARGRIAERIKNAYAAGHNDGRKGRLPDRMDEVADTEAGKILEIVLLVLMEQPNGYKTYRAAFGADDDGGER